MHFNGERMIPKFTSEKSVQIASTFSSSSKKCESNGKKGKNTNRPGCGAQLTQKHSIQECLQVSLLMLEKGTQWWLHFSVQVNLERTHFRAILRPLH